MVNPETGIIDMEEVRRVSLAEKPNDSFWF
jgi:hypothetical protein